MNATMNGATQYPKGIDSTTIKFSNCQQTNPGIQTDPQAPQVCPKTYDQKYGKKWKTLNFLLNGQNPLFWSFSHFLVA